jgi:hypothetical protein
MEEELIIPGVEKILLTPMRVIVPLMGKVKRCFHMKRPV